MDNRLLKVIELLMEYGYYSKPFVNWAIKQSTKIGWKYFMMAVRSNWKGDNEKQLIWIEKGLRSRKLTQTLKYIFLAHKMSTLTALKRPESKEIYNLLRTEFANIPAKARDIVISSLLSHPYFTNSSDLPDVRAWAASYRDKKNATKVYYLRGCARKELRTGNLKRAIELFKDSLNIALSLPHPTAIIGNLNDIAWYLKDKNSREALKYAREAAYWTGWYRENPCEVMYVFDTLFHVQLKAKDPEVVETANLILCFTNLRKPGDRYKSLIESCKKFQFNSGKSWYQNTKELRQFIRRRIKSINDLYKRSGVARTTITAIFKGNCERVRGETLRRILKAIDCIPLNVPYSIVNEWIKLRIMEKFEKALDTMKELPAHELVKRFIATYMSMENRSTCLSTLSGYHKLTNAINTLKYDREAIKNLASGDYELMKLVGDMFFPHPFIKGRMDLAMKFFERFPQKKIMKFIDRYIDLSESHRIVIDQFIRNYARYSRHWGVRIDPVEDLEGFISEYRLNRQAALLAYWVEENGKARKKLVRALEKFI